MSEGASEPWPPHPSDTGWDEVRELLNWLVGGRLSLAGFKWRPSGNATSANVRASL